MTNRRIGSGAGKLPMLMNSISQFNVKFILQLSPDILLVEL